MFDRILALIQEVREPAQVSLPRQRHIADDLMLFRLEHDSLSACLHVPTSIDSRPVTLMRCGRPR